MQVRVAGSRYTITPVVQIPPVVEFDHVPPAPAGQQPGQAVELRRGEAGPGGGDADYEHVPASALTRRQYRRRISRM